MKSTKAKKQTAVGVILWNVSVEYDGYDFAPKRRHTTLTIATRSDSMLAALKQATTYLTRNRFDFPKWKIDGAEKVGKIDA
jgi:hypothetical protein